MGENGSAIREARQAVRLLGQTTPHAVAVRCVLWREKGNYCWHANLDRVCGRDETGTLYIGCAAPLRSRLGQLIRSLVNPHNEEHPVGFIRRHELLSERFPLDRLAVRWLYVDYHEGAKQILINRYLRSFGELTERP